MRYLYKTFEMKKWAASFYVLILLFSVNSVFAQPNRNTQANDPVVQAIINEANKNSQLEQLGYELLDEIGPRLVGTPGMQKAHDWAVDKFNSWGIDAENQAWGEWRGWERGITHIDLVE